MFVNNDEIILIPTGTAAFTAIGPVYGCAGIPMVKQNGLYSNGAKGCLIVVNVTAVGGSAGSLSKIGIEALWGSSVAGEFQKVYEFTATTVNAAGHYYFMLYPCASLAAGSFNATPTVGVLPPVFRVSFTNTDTNSITYNAKLMFLN